MNPEDFSNMMSGLLSGNENSWSFFIDSFYPLIRGKISKMAPHLDVDDTAQEVYMQLINNDYRALRKVEGGFPAFLNFLIAVIENVAKSQIAKHSRFSQKIDHQKDIETNLEDKRYSIEIEFFRKEEEGFFTHIISQLDLTYLEVMQLRSKGYKAREIAEILKISQNTVLTKMRRGKEKIKKILDSEIKS